MIIYQLGKQPCDNLAYLFLFFPLVLMNDLCIFSLQHMHIGHQQHHFKEPEPLRWEISCGMNNALKEMNDNSELQPLDTMILLYSTIGIHLQANKWVSFSILGYHNECQIKFFFT